MSEVELSKKRPKKQTKSRAKAERPAIPESLELMGPDVSGPWFPRDPQVQDSSRLYSMMMKERDIAGLKVLSSRSGFSVSAHIREAVFLYLRLPSFPDSHWGDATIATALLLRKAMQAGTQ